jgi:hypothetical protein
MNFEVKTSSLKLHGSIYTCCFETGHCFFLPNPFQFIVHNHPHTCHRVAYKIHTAPLHNLRTNIYHLHITRNYITSFLVLYLTTNSDKNTLRPACCNRCVHGQGIVSTGGTAITSPEYIQIWTSLTCRLQTSAGFHDIHSVLYPIRNPPALPLSYSSCIGPRAN